MIKELRILISVIGLGAILLVLIVKYTDICRLQAVTLNGEPVREWNNQLGLRTDGNLFTQPVDSLANSMLLKNGIVDVKIKYQLPNTLNITTNSLLPVCYLLDATSGIMFGVDETGRVVPLDSELKSWDKPIFTGAEVEQIHDFSSDPRISALIPQLNDIKKKFPQIYPLLEEVALDNSDYVEVSISGLPYKLKIQADKFAQRFDEFQKFMDEYKPATSGVSCFDLTYNDMIIRVGYTEEKKKEPVDTSAVNDKAGFDGEYDEPVLSQNDQKSDEKEITPKAQPDSPKLEPVITPIKDKQEKVAQNSPKGKSSTQTKTVKNNPAKPVSTLAKQTNTVKKNSAKSAPLASKTTKQTSVKKSNSKTNTNKAVSQKTTASKQGAGKSTPSKVNGTKPSSKKSGTLANKTKPQQKAKKSGKNG